MVAIRFSPTTRTLSLQVSRRLAPEARSRLVAATARKGFADVQEINRRALGSIPDHDTFVDGRANAQLESVNPDRGVILFAFRMANEAFEWIDAMLIMHSPVLTGAYAKSHRFYADGIEADPLKAPPAREYVFLNVQPYAGKIERGQSKQAPDGVYEAVASLASKRFGNTAQVRFSYRAPVDIASLPRGQKARDDRRPAIVVMLR